MLTTKFINGRLHSSYTITNCSVAILGCTALYLKPHMWDSTTSLSLGFKWTLDSLLVSYGLGHETPILSLEFRT